MSSMVSERIPAEQRREEILAAASRVFGERGYVGATTDQVARAAGISQPYVVRLFGTKENLFVEVLNRALYKLKYAFREAAQTSNELDEDIQQRVVRLGSSYADLISDRGILLSLMQGFISGHEPVIGACARSGFLEIYRLLKDDAHLNPEVIVEFLANGMLFNTLIAMRMIDESISGNDCALELLKLTFKTKFDLIFDEFAKDENKVRV